MRLQNIEPMIIRQATKDDVSSILFLIKELATFEKEPDAVVVTEQELLENGFGNQPLFQTIVAEMAGEIVGMALFYYRFSSWKGKTLHLEDLIVQQKHRGKGVGLALYKAFIQTADQLGVRRIEWVVLNWNKTAIDFYEKSGAKILADWQTVQMAQENIKQFISEN
jgi:GNAT superfamily N-acetyltransferase